MDLVSVAMDVLLAGLLVAALAYGVRLERKLKALRESHDGFALAVRQLDGAAARAEAGLESLRQATEEARDGLHDRILKARELKTELERLIARAERSETGAPAATPVPEIAPARTAPARERPRLEPREAVREPLREPPLRLGAADRMGDRPRDAAPAARRPRALDDDLFEAPTAPTGRFKRTRGDDR